jgi:hypothetical protein
MMQENVVNVLVGASLTCARGAVIEAVMAGVIRRIPRRSFTGVEVAVRLADAARVATGQDFAHRAD